MAAKILRFVVSGVLIAIVVCAGYLTSSTRSAHAASVKPVQVKSSSTEPEWAIRADPYVHVVNYVAYINPTISRVLSAADVALVKSSVSYYNAGAIHFFAKPKW